MEPPNTAAQSQYQQPLENNKHRRWSTPAQFAETYRQYWAQNPLRPLVNRECVEPASTTASGQSHHPPQSGRHRRWLYPQDVETDRLYWDHRRQEASLRRELADTPSTERYSVDEGGKLATDRDTGKVWARVFPLGLDGGTDNVDEA